MTNTIHTMNHETIEFSSLNYKQVKHFEKVLKPITENDIKTGNVKGRHALLLNMACAGHSPLSEDYFYLRGVKQDMINSGVGEDEALQTIFKNKGWIL